MMPEAFHDAGFHTAAFSESPWIRDKFGWGKGFDRFEHVPGLYDHQGLRWTRDPGATARTLERAREWISGQGDDRWFCYVHLLRPHDPYDAPAEFTSRYTREPHRGHDHVRAEHVIREVAVRDRAAVTDNDIEYLVDMYDANIRYVDELVGDFYEDLKRAGVTDDTLIVLMSDHGEAFMEHGDLGHNTTVYEEMTHVPLAIVGPRGHGFARGVHGGLVDLVDLMPTFADLFGMTQPAPYVGRSLASVLRGRPEVTRTTSIAHSAMDHFRFYVRDGDLKLIVHVNAEYSEIQSYELYNLANDPDERVDLAADKELAAPILEQATAYLAGIERRDTADDPVLETDDVEALKALGYLPSD
jgi:arylsulfatase A-like enzyme